MANTIYDSEKIHEFHIYKASNKNFGTRSGDFNIRNYCSSATLSVELNGTWKVDLEIFKENNPFFNSISVGDVIKTATWMEEEQLFRIQEIEKNEETMSVTAYPIFLDVAHDIYWEDSRPTNVDGQGWMNYVIQAGTPKSGNRYFGYSDITKTATAYYIRKNAIECLSGDEENGFLSRWGGEVLYDNYKVYVNNRVGTDTGIKIEAGVNMNGLTETIDTSELCTELFPVGYNGITATFVQSDRLNDYPVTYTQTIELNNYKLEADASDEDKNGETDAKLFATEEDLKNAMKDYCKTYFNESQCDLPKYSYECNLVDMSNDVRYSKFTELEEITIGDTVQIYHKDMGILTSARVTALTYDMLAKKNIDVQLGNFGDTIRDIGVSLQKVNNTISGDTLKANTLTNIISQNSPSNSGRLKKEDQGYWDLQSGEMNMVGNITVRKSSNKNKLVEIASGDYSQIMFYSGADNESGIATGKIMTSTISSTRWNFSNLKGFGIVGDQNAVCYMACGRKNMTPSSTPSTWFIAQTEGRIEKGYPPMIPNTIKDCQITFPDGSWLKVRSGLITGASVKNTGEGAITDL